MIEDVKEKCEYLHDIGEEQASNAFLIILQDLMFAELVKFTSGTAMTWLGRHQIESMQRMADSLSGIADAIESGDVALVRAECRKWEELNK